VITAGNVLPLLKAALRTPWLWLALTGFSLGAWGSYGLGFDAGHAQGVEVGQQAEQARQAKAALDGTRDAIRDRKAAEDEAMDEFNRAGGNLERLCETDPACRDRHRLRLD